MHEITKSIIKRMRFEQVVFFSIMIILTASLFMFGGDKEILNLILGAFIGAFTRTDLFKKESDKLE